MKHYFRYCFSFFCFCVLLTFICMQGYGQCTGGQATVQIQVVEDQWADQETRWELINVNTGAMLGTGTPEGTTICVSSTACLVFNIYDTYGDGLINGGSYTVRYNGVVMASGGNFGSFATVQMGVCSPGISCSNALTAFADSTYTAPGPNTWYVFTPDTVGTFTFSTCTGNSCSTAIWLYSYCQGLQWDDTQQATISFSNSGCGDQATFTTYLSANLTYYVRIGDEGTSCQNTPIQWSITYDGPVIGCMDQTSCNFNPLATINNPSQCLYEPNALCPDGPDLMVMQNVLASSIAYQTRSSNDPCLVQEGCMQGSGTRKIIRFTTHIKNIGNQDYFIGVPSATNSQFEWDLCHNHWHYEGYAEYLLYDMAGNKIPIGFKNGFCVLDLECSGGGSAKYGCSNMGITAGCGDIYNSSLDCQWIDITNVPTGQYMLVVRVNWDNSPDKLGHYETTLSNNWAQVCLQITQNGTSATVTQVPGCSPYIDCLGQLYGDAQPDCDGVCAGQHRAGDWDIDYQYDYDDRTSYMNAIVDANQVATICNDLNQDDTLTILDPVLLNACLHQQLGLHVDATDHCDLPKFNVLSPSDSAWFSIGEHNISQQYIDLYMTSNEYVVGFQFRITGLDIISVTSLVSDPMFTPGIYFNAGNGNVALYSIHEQPLDRYGVPTPVLRIYYAVPGTPDDICIEHFTVANAALEEMIGIAPACVVPHHSLQLSVWLQGTFVSTTQTMNNALTQGDHLPLAQPFNVAPWNYQGSESFATSNQIHPNTVDWLLIELLDATSGVLVQRRAGLLRSDGSVHDSDGGLGISFYGIDGLLPYRVIVRSRNHLAIISASTLTLNNTVAYAICAPLNVTGGSSMVRLLAGSSPPRYGMIAGDIDANGVINVLDFNRYMAQLSHIGVYEEGDCDLDGRVLIQDFNWWRPNASVIGVPQVRY